MIFCGFISWIIKSIPYIKKICGNKNNIRKKSKKIRSDQEKNILHLLNYLKKEIQVQYIAPYFLQ